MWNYIWLSAAAWLMGFFPLFEIYLAIPAAMAMGLDPVSSVIWAGLGNFFAVPFIIFFYNQLERIKKIKQWLTKMANNRFRPLIEKYGAYIILVMTPIIGIWAVAVIARLIGMNKKKLFISSAISIGIYGIIIALLMELGIELFQ